ncbi:MAG TPA: hypothetical protein ENI81_13035 [Phycisphaerales bacterium]|nr:hypothetical protein [Phycisphaerales bacterium]
MGGLRKLRRRSSSTDVVEPLRTNYVPRTEKLSAVILDFARPLTDSLDDRDFKGAICIAIFCWNIALLPEDEQERERCSVVQKLTQKAPEIADDIQTWSRKLLDRKKALFADDRRMVVEYRVTEEGDFHHLFVLSTPLPSSPRR